jgi:CDP-diacylglycerol--serine O-phosphatidyltransferase
VDFRKTYYILPNLFTLSSILCGFASLALSASGRSEGTDLYLAALAICFGLFFDTFDGRVARLTKTQTDLGRDLDSLADVITFGAAPALLVYKWGLTGFGFPGMLIAGSFVCAGAMRLARFNVLSRRAEAAGQKTGKFTLGLAIPPAAGVLVFMVIVSHNVSEYRLISEGSTAVVVLILSYLMVSRVRFRSFKELRFTLKTVGVVALIVGASATWVWAGFAKAFIFLLLVLAYIVLGLTEEVLFYRRRRRQERKASEPPLPEPPVASDEDVLRELGAFDEEPRENEPEKNGGHAPATTR